MGVDEALLESAEAGVSSLRFYTWSSPCLSLGYSQRMDDGMRAACDASQTGWVRRVTGGRALLHGGDLTYTVAAPLRALPGGLNETYEKIGRVLLEALHALGVPAEQAQPNESGPGAEVFDCFAKPAGHEIVLGGSKLVGSAQRRTRRALLQHGSIRCNPDPSWARGATGLEGAGSTSLAQWGEVAESDLREALGEAFSGCLDVRLTLGELTAEEQARAATRGQEPEPVPVRGQATGRGGPPLRGAAVSSDQGDCR